VIFIREARPEEDFAFIVGNAVEFPEASGNDPVNEIAIVEIRVKNLTCLVCRDGFKISNNHTEDLITWWNRSYDHLTDLRIYYAIHENCVEYEEWPSIARKHHWPENIDPETLQTDLEKWLGTNSVLPAAKVQKREAAVQILPKNRPSCPLGFTKLDILLEIGKDRVEEFESWMSGQTMCSCEGRAYNHDLKKYEPDACFLTPHGPIVYAGDLIRFLNKYDIVD